MKNSMLLDSTETSNDCEFEKLGFFELVNHLRGSAQFNLNTLYLKNIEMLKESLKIDKKMPDFEQIKIFFKDLFLTK